MLLFYIIGLAKAEGKEDERSPGRRGKCKEEKKRMGEREEGKGDRKEAEKRPKETLIGFEVSVGVLGGTVAGEYALSHPDLLTLHGPSAALILRLLHQEVLIFVESWTPLRF